MYWMLEYNDSVENQPIIPLQGMNDEERQAGLAKIYEIMPHLPDRDHDIIYMYFLLGKTQAEIAYVLKLTQAAISYRIKRATHRLRFWATTPKINEDLIWRTLTNKVATIDDEVIRIFVTLWNTSSQSRTAEALGTSQGRVRNQIVSRLLDLSDHVLSTLPPSKMVPLIKIPRSTSGQDAWLREYAIIDLLRSESFPLDIHKVFAGLFLMFRHPNIRNDYLTGGGTKLLQQRRERIQDEYLY